MSLLNLLYCEKCGKYTTELETSRRTFNNGLCAYCGGGLIKVPEPKPRLREALRPHLTRRVKLD